MLGLWLKAAGQDPWLGPPLSSASPIVWAGPGAAKRDSHALTRLTYSEGRPGTRQGLCVLFLPESHPELLLRKSPETSGGGGVPSPPQWSLGLALAHILSREQQREANANPAVPVFPGGALQGGGFITKAASRGRFLPCLPKQQGGRLQKLIWDQLKHIPSSL